MFFNHVKSYVILFILYFSCLINGKGVNRIHKNCGRRNLRESKVGCIFSCVNGISYKGRIIKHINQINRGEDKRKRIRNMNIFLYIPINKYINKMKNCYHFRNIIRNDCFFFINKYIFPFNIKKIHSKYTKKFVLFKKGKGSDNPNPIKKKDKKTFSEEEIEELRKKAKEKSQANKSISEESKRKKSIEKGMKRKRYIKNQKQLKQKKKSTSDEDKKKKELKDKDDIEDNMDVNDIYLSKSKDSKDKIGKDEDMNSYIKNIDDFEKISNLTKNIINEKEIEYLQKIVDCDDQLLKYDKREKNIKLNVEDTIFDEGNYMEYYINNISKFRYDIYNLNNKNEFDRLTKYLNYQYVQEIPVTFPTDKSYNIQLKKYFYETVCELINKNKDRFQNYIVPQENIYHSNDMIQNNIQNGSMNLMIEKKNINVNNDNKNIGNIGNNNNIVLENFIRENEKEKIETETNSTINKIEEGITNPYDKSEENIMKKYMTYDLYNVLCDIKDEYEYMFDNGGLEKFSFDTNRIKNKEKLVFTGKKKRALAHVFLERGNNNLIINNRDGYQYIQYQILNLNKIFSPLLNLCLHRHFNIIATVEGGGLSGQSVAIFHALVKYIVYNFSLKIKPYFRSLNFMTVDSRKVERKKYGLKKARKKKQYSKR
ncbi:30S ribosomal protein S9, putative [Plasmodium sp. gorilla clade G2]|uniref:30S ribosomal protein S9, putative n=1 Tax=Plasmodium sp. gorilla clade G2 TaxID=880535 RepID=UPI000D212515|nr:30S ribosomal protein S9, putative [Plasmodium sp. gorilla clade G2]SOV18789.1 30S ribosomal protein S9, putative [Plasmodium sp. gorilla clade G2]